MYMIAVGGDIRQVLGNVVRPLKNGAGIQYLQYGGVRAFQNANHYKDVWVFAAFSAKATCTTTLVKFHRGHFATCPTFWTWEIFLNVRKGVFHRWKEFCSLLGVDFHQNIWRAARFSLLFGRGRSDMRDKGTLSVNRDAKRWQGRVPEGPLQ